MTDMRKFFMIIFSAVFLTGCSELMDDILYQLTDDERVTKEVVEEESDVNGDSQTTRNNNLIDDQNFLQEREEIENLMEKQRELLKPGFIKNEKNVIDMHLGYFPFDGTLQYSAYYDVDTNVPIIFYKSITDVSEILLEDRYSEFQDKKKLDHNKIDGFYGLYGDSYQTYDMWGEYEGSGYNIGIREEDDVDNEKLIELITQTLKSEAAGAYDPLYSLFSIDVDKVKFPKLNSDYAEVDEVVIDYLGYEDKSFRLKLAYRIGGYDMITYSILEKEEAMSDYYEQKGEEVTADGIIVTEYKHVDRDNEIYKWTDGTYFYELEFWKKDKSLINSADIYAIIDSAMQDERTFENKDIFKATNVHPKLGKPEEELEKFFSKLKQK